MNISDFRPHILGVFIISCRKTSSRMSTWTPATSTFQRGPFAAITIGTAHPMKMPFERPEESTFSFWASGVMATSGLTRSEEHTSELQSQSNLVCRLLLEKKKKASIHASLLLH